MSEAVRAVVQNVIMGKHGLFMVTKAEGIDGSVTCSLEPSAWKEEVKPEPGEIVLLDGIVGKRSSGKHEVAWRAKQGRYFTPSDEQTANRKEQAMKIINQFNEAWPLSSEDEKVWHQFVDSGEDFDGLMSLLQQDVREEFKARVTFLLLTPSNELLPFHWKGGYFGTRWSPWRVHEMARTSKLTSDGVGRYLLSLRALSPKLLSSTSQLIGGFQEYASSRIDSEDRYHYQLCLKHYNHWNLELLTVLPPEEAKQAFARFSLNDIEPLNNDWASVGRYDISGYNPFEDLLEREDVDEEWKRLANEKVRQVILAELNGEKKPRAEWEDAIRCYQRIIFSPYIALSTRLFASQVSFLLDTGVAFAVSHVPKIFRTLADEGYQDLRFQIARHFVLEEGNGEVFTPSYYGEYPGDLDKVIIAGQTILAEFGEKNPELSQKLRPLVEALVQRKADSDALHRKYQARERSAKRAILAQMM